MTKDKLNEIFEQCREEKSGIKIEITIPGQIHPEAVINVYESLRNKQNYYNKAYNENLELLDNPEVKIINAKPVRAAMFSNSY